MQSQMLLCHVFSPRKQTVSYLPLKFIGSLLPLTNPESNFNYNLARHVTTNQLGLLPHSHQALGGVCTYFLLTLILLSWNIYVCEVYIRGNCVDVKLHAYEYIPKAFRTVIGTQIFMAFTSRTLVGLKLDMQDSK